MLLVTDASRKWRRRFYGVLALLVASYVFYWISGRFMHGGSPAGLAYGVLGTLAVLVLLYYGVRKRSYRSRMGTLEGWLQAHLYLGFLSAVLILFHTGMRFEDDVAVAAFVVLLIVVASGFWGALAYTSLPRRLTAVQGDLTPEEMSAQLNQLGRAMDRLAAGKSTAFRELAARFVGELAPRPFAGWRILGRARATGDFLDDKRLKALVARVVAEEQPELRQLVVLARQRRELNGKLVAQQRYKNLLEVWLYLHLPLSIALVALVVAHLVAVFYYSKVSSWLF